MADRGGAPLTDDELIEAFPGVRIDRDNAGYYTGLLDRRLLLNRCDDCGHRHHPPRPICPKCWSFAVSPAEVAGTGTVALITILRQGSRRPGVDYTDGHAVVAVDLDEQRGLRLAGTVVGTPADQLSLGDRVRVHWSSYDRLAPQPDFEVIA